MLVNLWDYVGLISYKRNNGKKVPKRILSICYQVNSTSVSSLDYINISEQEHIRNIL